jgi:hypothetical protein
LACAGVSAARRRHAQRGRMTKIRSHSIPSPRPLVDGPAPGYAEGQGAGELDEANDLAHQ